MWPAAPRPGGDPEGRGPARRRDGRAEGPRPAGVALILAVLAFLPGFSGCEPAPPPPPASDAELREELGVPDTVPIHRMSLAQLQGRVRILPPRIAAEPGDLVQLVAVDHGAHLVRFLLDEMEAEAAAFLRETGQDRPPPLTEREARLVLSFRDAPGGSYPFVVESGGFEGRGEIRVRRR